MHALQRLQSVLSFNPADEFPVKQSAAFNAAVSFITNTNWQGYSGGSTMSYLTQMAALTTQNFASAAAGIAIAIARVRGFARRSAQTIGLAIAGAAQVAGVRPRRSFRRSASVPDSGRCSGRARGQLWDPKRKLGSLPLLGASQTSPCGLARSHQPVQGGHGSVCADILTY
jgi:hypothetical protein